MFQIVNCLMAYCWIKWFDSVSGLRKFFMIDFNVVFTWHKLFIGIKC